VKSTNAYQRESDDDEFLSLFILFIRNFFLIRRLYMEQKNLVLLPGQKVDQHFQELAPGQWK